MFAVTLVGIWLFYQYSSDARISNDASSAEVIDFEYQETVLEETRASTSKDIPCASDVSKELSDRGFSELELSATYDLEGKLLEDEGVDGSSNDKYPLYYAYYFTPDDNLWIIYVCNGSYLADSVFACEHGTPSVLLTEEDFVTCYLANEDTFVKSIPDKEEQLFKRVDRIDAETLDSLSIEELKKL